MRLITANVNGIRAAHRRDGLRWLADRGPDVLALQEVRAGTDQLHAVLQEAGLGGWQVAHAPGSDAGRAGVAVLSRTLLEDVRVGLPGFEDAGRWVQARTCGMTVASAYVHTGAAGTERQEQKYAFLDRMDERMAELAGTRAVVTGDLNICHRAADLRNWKGNLGKAGFLPDERAHLDRWSAGGWVDVVRAHAGETDGPYTWWSWRGKAFDNDTGWRIDYQWASPGAARATGSVLTGRAPSYAERWSDHAAVVVDYDTGPES